MFNREMALSVVRHIFSMGGAWLATRGLIDGAHLESLTGFGMAAIAFGWSILDKDTPPTKDMVLAMARHGATALGGFGIAAGFVTEAQVGDITLALVSLAGFLWGALDKK